MLEYSLDDQSIREAWSDAARAAAAAGRKALKKGRSLSHAVAVARANFLKTKYGKVRAVPLSGRRRELGHLDPPVNKASRRVDRKYRKYDKVNPETGEVTNAKYDKVMNRFFNRFKVTTSRATRADRRKHPFKSYK